MARLIIVQEEDPMDLKSRLKWTKLLRLLIFNVFRVIIQIYILYMLFYQENGIYRRAALVISFISTTVTTCFGVRILYRNNESTFKTLILIAFITLIIHHNMALAFNHEQVLKRFVSDVVTLSFAALQTVPITVQLRELQYAIRCKMAEVKNDVKKRKECYNQMIQAEINAGFVTEIECYLRAASQAIVQVALILNGSEGIGGTPILQQMSIIAPFLMMPWFITSFQSLMKRQKYDWEGTWFSKSLYWTAIFSTLVSRIVSIASAAAFWPLYTGLFVLAHWVMATVWIFIRIKPEQSRMMFCEDSKLYKYFLCLIFGVFYVFKPINLGEESSRVQYISFYVIFLIENVLASIVWGLSSNSSRVLVIISTNHGLFFVGIALMVLYYKKFHPKAEDEDIPLEHVDTELCDV